MESGISPNLKNWFEDLILTDLKMCILFGLMPNLSVQKMLALCQCWFIWVVLQPALREALHHMSGSSDLECLCQVENTCTIWTNQNTTNEACWMDGVTLCGLINLPGVLLVCWWYTAQRNATQNQHLKAIWKCKWKTEIDILTSYSSFGSAKFRSTWKYGTVIISIFGKSKKWMQFHVWAFLVYT